MKEERGKVSHKQALALAEERVKKSSGPYLHWTEAAPPLLLGAKHTLNTAPRILLTLAPFLTPSSSHILHRTNKPSPSHLQVTFSLVISFFSYSFPMLSIYVSFSLLFLLSFPYSRSI